MSRVTEIRYVGYGVEDLDVESAFYAEKWGLVEVAAEDDMVWLRAQGHDEPFVVRLRRSKANRIDVIALATATRADVDALHEKVTAAGCRIIHRAADPRRPGGGYGFRFFSPDGLPFEISSDVARGPRRDIARWEGMPVKISHIVLHSPNHKGLVTVHDRGAGLSRQRLARRLHGFLRCNSAHHRIAILPGPPCLNHVAYDMTGIDGMMRGIGRLKKLMCRSAGARVATRPATTPSAISSRRTASPWSTPPNSRRWIDATWQPKVHAPAPRVMDQWGIGVGGPQTMPHPTARSAACSSRQRCSRWRCSSTSRTTSGISRSRSRWRAAARSARSSTCASPSARPRRGARMPARAVPAEWVRKAETLIGLADEDAGARPRLLRLRQAAARRAVPAHRRAHAGPGPSGSRSDVRAGARSPSTPTALGAQNVRARRDSAGARHDARAVHRARRRRPPTGRRLLQRPRQLQGAALLVAPAGRRWRAAASRRCASTSPAPARRCACRGCPRLRTASAGPRRPSTGSSSSRMSTRSASA